MVHTYNEIVTNPSTYGKTMDGSARLSYRILTRRALIASDEPLTDAQLTGLVIDEEADLLELAQIGSLRSRAVALIALPVLSVIRAVMSAGEWAVLHSVVTDTAV